MIPVYSAKPPKRKPQRVSSRKPTEPFKLGKTGRTITLLLARYLFLSANQLAAAALIQSQAHVQRELRYLLQPEHGWLLRSAYLREHDIGKAPFVYTLDAKAWEWVGQQGFPIPYRFRPSEEVGKVSPHTMAIAAFGVALERYCRRSQCVQIAQFRHERVLPWTKVSLADGTTARLRPDAWVQLAIARPDGLKQRCYVVEADRASEYQKEFRDKIQRLLAYRKEPYRAQFGTESIAFLFTAPTPHRRKLIATYIEAEIAEHEQRAGKKVRPDLFWITDVDPKEADADLFTAPCWHHPFKSNPVPLLDLSPSARPGGRETAFSANYLGEPGMLRFYQELGQRPPATALESDIDETVD